MKLHQIDGKTRLEAARQLRGSHGLPDARVGAICGGGAGATPVLAELREGTDVVGYFTGLTFSKFGMKVLGSSFLAGHALHRVSILRPVFAARGLEASLSLRGRLKCLHMEVSIRTLRWRTAKDWVQGRVLRLVPHGSGSV